MKTALPKRLFKLLFSFFSALYFSQPAVGQDQALSEEKSSQPVLQKRVRADGNNNALRMKEGLNGDKLGVAQDTERYICTIEVRIPERYVPPMAGKNPRRLARLGIELAFVATPLAGQRGRLIIHPIYNQYTAPVITMEITGPNGYSEQSDIHMPMKVLEVCEPIPHYHNSCNGPQATTRFYPTQPQTPALGAPGRYTFTLSGTSRRGFIRRHFIVDVDAHPIAEHLQLPEGVQSADQESASLRVLTNTEPAYSGPALVKCGEKGHTNFCVRMSNDFPQCTEVLQTNPELHHHAVGSAEATEHFTERPKVSESWCHKNRLVTLEHNHTWKKKRLLRSLQEVLPPDPVELAGE